MPIAATKNPEWLAPTHQEQHQRPIACATSTAIATMQSNLPRHRRASDAWIPNPGNRASPAVQSTGLGRCSDRQPRECFGRCKQSSLEIGLIRAVVQGTAQCRDYKYRFRVYDAI